MWEREFRQFLIKQGILKEYISAICRFPLKPDSSVSSLLMMIPWITTNSYLRIDVDWQKNHNLWETKCYKEGMHMNMQDPVKFLSVLRKGDKSVALGHIRRIRD